MERGYKKAEVLTDTVKRQWRRGLRRRVGVGAGLQPVRFRSGHQDGRSKKIEPASAPASGTSLMLPVGFHNSMETLTQQMEQRGEWSTRRQATWRSWHASRMSRGVTSMLRAATNAVMAGGNWQPMLQASQWQLFHVGDEHLAVSEEDDAVYRLRLDS